MQAVLSEAFLFFSVELNYVRPLYVFQVEITPYFANSRIVEFCREKGMVITAYAPLGAPNRPW